MTHTAPIYTAENVQAAYQLNWSLSIFSRQPISAASQWLEPLKPATEKDGVRILEYRLPAANTHQFFLSTRPDVVPSSIIKSVKGRLQHAIHVEYPAVFKRNYRLESVGETHNETLQGYVGRQAQHHLMADPRVQQRIESLQYHDPEINLATLQRSSHGEYIVNFHLVFENRDRLVDIREEALRGTREMIVAAARKKDYRLSRIGLAANHIHLLLGCGVSDAPLSVAVSFMNNIAFAHEIKAVLDFSFYAGTFGNYDRHAIRQHL